MLNSTYGPILAVPAVRRAVLVGFLVRMPMFSIPLVTTVHVVTALGRSYAAAGLASAVLLASIGLGAPWRGRLLDRHGLRPVVGPAILVQAFAASTAPFVGFEPLLAVCALAGLFTIPGHALIRQAVISAVPENQRRAALSLDGIVLELSAAVGPGAAVAVAAAWSTRWVLFTVMALWAVAGMLLWWQNLPIHTTRAPEPGEAAVDRSWLGLRFLLLLAACAVSTVVLSATDLGIVALLREWNRPAAIGPVFAVWALGSLVGGLVYGSWHRSLDMRPLLLALAALTALPALATGPWTLGLTVFVGGALCQPVITAGVEMLTEIVPDRARGEALGWHGTSMTGGNAIGAPLTGLVIDGWGAQWAFLAAALLGAVVAVLGMVGPSRARMLRQARRSRRAD